ncbi:MULTISPECIES: ImcF-related family protein [unclassified Cupriavidus]|nr:MULTISPECIES: ImcF-related family protein [unclassified Cupriavidus]
MNENDSSPAVLWFGIAIGVIFLALMVAALVKGPNLGWSGDRLVAIELRLLATGLLLLLFIRFFEAILLKIASMKAVQWALMYDRRKPASGAAVSTLAFQHAVDQRKSLRDALRSLHGWRWRYRQPWLLLTGSDNLIDRLVPESADHGWQILPDAVLIRSNADADGQPDASWLRQIYRLRRRRPVDAVLLVTDGSELTPTCGGFQDNIQLTRITEALRWSAPVYVLEVTQAEKVADGDMPVIACEVPAQGTAEAIRTMLLVLRDRLAHRFLARLPEQRHLGRLSLRLDDRSGTLATRLCRLISDQYQRPRFRGVLFGPYDAAKESPGIELPIWHYVADDVRRRPGRRTVWHPLTILAGLALTSAALWIAGMLISGLRNERDLQAARQAVHDIQTAPTPTARLKALDTLQQQIQRYEYRVEHHAPLFTRFGLNRDTEVLAALWKPYAKAGRDILVTPVVIAMFNNLAFRGIPR